MATTLRFVILGDDQASKSFDKFARSIDNANKSIAKNKTTLASQKKAQDDDAASASSLANEILGLGSAQKLASGEGSAFTKVMAGMDLATGILEPALAGLIVTIGGTAAAAVTAGAGLGVFALVAKQEFGAAATAAKAYQKAQAQVGAAKTQDSKAAAIKAEAAATAGLTSSQRGLMQAIIGVEGQWQTFLKIASPGADAVLTKGLALFPRVLQLIEPLLKPVEQALSGLLTELSSALWSKGAESFTKMLAGSTGQAIMAFGESIGNIVVGLGGILKAFMPVQSGVLSGVQNITAEFRQWGTTLSQHTGFQALMETFKGETPQAVAVLKNLGVVIKNIADDMTGLATPANSRALLNILQPLSQLLVTATNNQGLVKIALYLLAIRGAAKQVAGPVNAVKGAFTSIAGGVTTLGRLRDGFKSTAAAESEFSGKAGTIGGILAKLAASPWTWAVAGAAAVTALGVVLVRTADQAGDLIAEFKKQDQASGFNISGYQKLAAQLSTVNDGQSKLSQTVRLSEGAVSLAKNGASSYSLALGEVTTAQTAAQRTAASLVGQLGSLQTGYGITQKQAEQLAVKAGVSATQLAASGTAGQQALAKVIGWANGAGQATVAADQWANQTGGLTRALQGLSSGLLTAQGNELGWQQAVDGAKASLANSTAGLQGNSTAAIANRSAVLQSTTAAVQFAQSQVAMHGNIQSASSVLQQQIQFLQSTGDHSKFVTDEIDALRTALAKLKSKKLTVDVHGDGTYSVAGVGVGHGLVPGSVPGQGKAAGGLIRGPGGPTADKAGVFALSNKEYVMKAAAVQKYGVHAMDAINAGRMAAGGLVGAYSGAPAPGEGNWITKDYNATVQLIEDATVKAATAAVNASAAGGAPGGAAIGPGAAAAQAYAKGILKDYGWGPGQFPPLQSLWNGESGWNYKAYNASSGATGIPQSLPGSKMASAGADWRTNPATQIRWGLGYIKGRYGSPATAWSDWLGRSPHWYAGGGPINEPVAGIGLRTGQGYRFGEAGSEHVMGQADIASLIDEVRQLRADVKKSAADNAAATAAGVNRGLNGLARGVVTR